MKYRKKPVVIEAFQYDGDLKDSNREYYVPDWAVKAFEDGIMHYDSPDCDSPPCELYIDTLEGTHHVSVGDYIIQGVDGELYPCKPEIFAKTYEATSAEIENPKVMILSDGDRTILYLNGEHVRGEATDFLFHADVVTGERTVMCSGVIQEKNENGDAFVRNNEIARQKFHYDSKESQEIKFEEVK